MDLHHHPRREVCWASSDHQILLHQKREMQEAPLQGLRTLRHLRLVVERAHQMQRSRCHCWRAGQTSRNLHLQHSTKAGNVQRVLNSVIGRAFLFNHNVISKICY